MFKVYWGAAGVGPDLYPVQQLAHAPEAVGLDVPLGVQRQRGHVEALHVLDWNRQKQEVKLTLTPPTASYYR